MDTVAACALRLWSNSCCAQELRETHTRLLELARSESESVASAEELEDAAGLPGELAPALLRALSGTQPGSSTPVSVPATHVLVAVTLLAPLPAPAKAGMLCEAFVAAAGSPPGLADHPLRPLSMSGGGAVEMLHAVQGVAALLAAVATPPALHGPTAARFEALLDADAHRLARPAARGAVSGAVSVVSPLARATSAVATLPRERRGDRELDCIPTTALQRVLSCQLPWAALLRLWCSPDRAPAADLQAALQRGAGNGRAIRSAGGGERGAEEEEEEQYKDEGKDEEEEEKEEALLLRGPDETQWASSPLQWRDLADTVRGPAVLEPPPSLAVESGPLGSEGMALALEAASALPAVPGRTLAQDSRVGLSGPRVVTLHVTGEPTPIRVPPRVPCLPDGRPAASSAANASTLWPALVERAVATVRDGYHALSAPSGAGRGRWSAAGEALHQLEDITGCPVVPLSAGGEPPPPWRDLVQRMRVDALLVAWEGPGGSLRGVALTPVAAAGSVRGDSARGEAGVLRLLACPHWLRARAEWHAASPLWEGQEELRHTMGAPVHPAAEEAGRTACVSWPQVRRAAAGEERPAARLCALGGLGTVAGAAWTSCVRHGVWDAQSSGGPFDPEAAGPWLRCPQFLVSGLVPGAALHVTLWRLWEEASEARACAAVLEGAPRGREGPSSAVEVAVVRGDVATCSPSGHLRDAPGRVSRLGHARSPGTRGTALHVPSVPCERVVVVAGPGGEVARGAFRLRVASSGRPPPRVHRLE